MLILYGQQGAGKTSVAKIYLEIVKAQKLRDVRWFSFKEIEKDYVVFARELNNNDEIKDETKLIEKVNKIFEKRQTKLFLVIDNVEDYEKIQKYINKMPLRENKIKFLLTTQNENLQITNQNIKFKTIADPFAIH